MAETIGTAYIQIEPSTKGIKGKIGKAIEDEANQGGNALSNAFKKAGKIGVEALAGATSAVGAFAKSAISAGMDFDTAMSQIGATMGMSVEEINQEGSEANKTFNQLRDFAQEMGRATAFSATEASEALNYMALAGYDAETSMNMLPTVLNLASAGALDLADASDMVTDAQTALGLSLDETSAMVDQMAMTASKSNTSVGQLGEAFLTIGANARNVKGGTQELSTVLGILADNGIKGSEAGTHLRNIMLSLTPKSEAAAEAMEKIGMKAYDANGELRALPDIFNEMSIAMAGMTDQEKTQTLSAIFNKTDLASINALIGTSATRFEELSGAIGDAQGSAQEMANVQLDNLGGDITLFKSALEGAQIAISDSLTPTLREFVQMGSDGLSEVTSAFTSGGLDSAFEALGTFLSNALAKIVEMLPKLIEAGGKLLGALVQGIIDNAPLLLNSALEVTLQLANGIIESLPTLIPAIVDIVLQIVQTLLDNLNLLVECALQLIIGLAEGLILAIPEIIARLPEIITSLVVGLIKLVPQILKVSVELITKLAVGLVSNVGLLLSKGGEILVSLYNKLMSLGSSFREIGHNIIQGIKNGIANAWNNLVSWFSGLFDDLIGIAERILGIASPSKVFKKIGQYTTEGFDIGMKDFGKGAIEQVEDSVSELSSMDLANTIVAGNTAINSAEIQASSDNGEMMSLLSKYLPAMAQPTNINVGLQGNASSLFRVVRNEANKFTKSTGYSAFA